MPPKGKKPIKNAFYYFMQEVREREEAKGRRFSGLKEVAEVADPLWSAMSLEEKEPYSRKASQAKGADDDGHNKFTSLGVSYAAIDAEARELQEANNIMLQTIRNTVRTLNRKSTLLTHKFYLCHVNYFYKTDSEFYSTAEIAFSEFNLEDGLIDRLHFFVDPGKIPLGYRYEAKDWSDKTHNIPYDWGKGEKDYYKLFEKIRNFLTKDKQTSIPPIYTMPNSLNSNMCLSAVKSTFASLCEAANEDAGQFRVYPFPQLFFEMRNKCAEMDEKALMPSVAIVENEIEKDVFSYAKDLGCQFHEENDRSIHCSLSIVTRWVYTICDHCCKHVGITLELGKHCPKDADVNWDYKYSRTVGRNAREDADTSSRSKDKNSFMPTIIDHGKLKEMRERQLQRDKESIRKAEEIRPPHSVIDPRFQRGRKGQKADREVDRLGNNLYEMNLHDDGMDRQNDDNYFRRGQEMNEIAGVRAGNRPRSGLGRGMPREMNEELAWPVSGRGRLVSQ